MTHRVYTNEYNKEFIYQLGYNHIEGLYTTDKSTSEVLVIEGEYEDLMKVCSLMYVEDESKIKEVFPSFQMKGEFEDAAAEARKKVFESLRDNILHLINMSSHRSDITMYGCDDYTELRKLYFEMCGE